MSAEPLDDISIDEQIQAVEELLHLGDISQVTMDEELDILRAILATLRRVKDRE